jgi:hypothetical protein
MHANQIELNDSPLPLLLLQKQNFRKAEMMGLGNLTGPS